VKEIGQAVESDIALAAGAVKSAEIGQATETDEAQAVTYFKSVTLGMAVELDLAQAVTWAKVKEIGQAVEMDTAFSVYAYIGSIPVGARLVGVQDNQLFSIDDSRRQHSYGQHDAGLVGVGSQQTQGVITRNLK
jgi:hypothetical protein